MAWLHEVLALLIGVESLRKKEQRLREERERELSYASFGRRLDQIHRLMADRDVTLMIYRGVWFSRDGPFTVYFHGRPIYCEVPSDIKHVRIPRKFGITKGAYRIEEHPDHFSYVKRACADLLAHPDLIVEDATRKHERQFEKTRERREVSRVLDGS